MRAAPEIQTQYGLAAQRNAADICEQFGNLLDPQVSETLPQAKTIREELCGSSCWIYPALHVPCAL